MRLSILSLLMCLILAEGVAQESDYLKVFDQALPQKANRELQFLAYFYNQGVTSNFYPRNDFLKGQVVGRLFGQNTTTTSDSLTTRYFEQRIIPFFIYQPKLFDGKAILRASFEIDWTWGDVAYGTGGNFGSAVSADQVNLQTQNLELELIPFPRWAINIGLQRLFDTPYNPYRTFFDRMTTSAYRLMYWGTDAVGVSVRWDGDFDRIKAGYYQLYENSIQEDDDVVLFEGMYQHDVDDYWKIGASLNFVRDRGNGEGGPSILGQGLNSQLAEYNGVYRFPFGGDPYRADIGWLGTFFSYNESFMMHPFLLTGFVNYNFGNIDLKKSGLWGKGVSISGLGANLRAGWRFGQTVEDAVILDLFYSSGDTDGIRDGKYNGIFTGNTWGAPGAVFISHGSYILFPHGNVVNRFVGAVPDLSNRGLGLMAASLALNKAFIPHKFSAKLGGVFAVSMAEPGNLYATPGQQTNIGFELNGKAAWYLGPFMQLEFHAAHMWLDDFFETSQTDDNPGQLPVNPWTAFIAFKWLMF